MEILSVVRLLGTKDHDPIERIITTVARVDLALADELHAGSNTRPYATVRRRDSLDVVCCRDDLTMALLKGDESAKLIHRAPMARFCAPAEGRYIFLAFLTPTHFRINGLDHCLPDAMKLFGSARERWKALGWPELPEANALRVAVRPRWLKMQSETAAKQEIFGFVGTARFDLAGVEQSERDVFWALARFAEFRGVGAHTSYGFGRVRILAPEERWNPNEPIVSAWER